MSPAFCRGGGEELGRESPSPGPALLGKSAQWVGWSLQTGMQLMPFKRGVGGGGEASSDHILEAKSESPELQSPLFPQLVTSLPLVTFNLKIYCYCILTYPRPHCSPEAPRGIQAFPPIRSVADCPNSPT